MYINAITNQSQPRQGKYIQKAYKPAFKSGEPESIYKLYIKQIENGSINPTAEGVISAFYRINDTYGIKTLNSNNNFNRHVNYNGEFEILKAVEKISSEIASKPNALIEHNQKQYLVTEFVKGSYAKSELFNTNHLNDLIKKCLTLDLNGVSHHDLHSGNIFLTSDKTIKFIDFGASSILLDDGSYLSSENYCENFKEILKTQRTKSLEERFLATYNQPKNIYDIKNYSDNIRLNMRSNISNFEHRFLYRYLKNKSENENAVEFLKTYFKSKAEIYHKDLLGFLEKLPSNSEKINKAKETEKMFIKIFTNPSERVLKAELGKIQFKWFLNSSKEMGKSFDYYNKYTKLLEELSSSAPQNEKRYFEEIKKSMQQYEEMITSYKGYKTQTFEKTDDIIELIFKHKKEIESSPISRNYKKYIIPAAIALSACAAIYTYSKYNSNKDAKPSKVNVASI